MCVDISKIMDMLDWNNYFEVQKEGRKLAESVQCLEIFLQPIDKRYNKNVWENCALILSKKRDDLLEPHLFKLIEWLKDLNWPGAYIILERLQNFKKYQKLALVLTECILVAKENEDDIWLMNMVKLADNENISVYLQDDIRELINDMES